MSRSIPSDRTRTDVPLVPAAVDHCLVHHFIRNHGRRPLPTELAMLEGCPGGRSAEQPDGSALARATLRRVAQLVHRL